MSGEAQEQPKNSTAHLKPYQFKKGESGNPGGRPKGSISIKEEVRRYLDAHPGEKREFVEHFIKKNRELAWQMLEGKPQQDITSGGEKLPAPLLANLDVSDHNSNKEDSSPQEEN